MLWCFVLTLSYVFSIAAEKDKSEMDLYILKPGPLLTPGNGDVATYQAITGENLTFHVVARVNTTKGPALMSIDVGSGSSEIPGCQRSHTCDGHDGTCTYLCNGCDPGITSSTLEHRCYKGEATSRYPDVTRRFALCIDVKNATVLTFITEPGDLVMSPHGDAILKYSVTGYPLPATTTLDCEGLMPITSTVGDGLFRLHNLPNGTTICKATAFNRVSRIYSKPTLIHVTSAGPFVTKLGVETESGSSSPADSLQPLSARSDAVVQGLSSIPTDESNQHSHTALILISFFVVVMLSVLIVCWHHQPCKATIMDNQPQTIINNNSVYHTEIGTSNHYVFINGSDFGAADGAQSALLSDAIDAAAFPHSDAS